MNRAYSASGAVPWVVVDGGLLVDVTSLDAIAEAVQRLLSDGALYEQVSARAVAVLTERFPLAKTANQYIELYAAG